MSTSAICLLSGVVLLSLGALLFWNGRRLQRLAAESVNWPHVEGLITKSKIWESEPGERHFNAEYAYIVGGQSFKGVITSIGKDESNLARWSAAYPEGKTLPVYYRPSKPSYSLLAAGAPHKVRYSILWGIVIVALGVIIFGLITN